MGIKSSLKYQYSEDLMSDRQTHLMIQKRKNAYYWRKCEELSETHCQLAANCRTAHAESILNIESSSAVYIRS